MLRQHTGSTYPRLPHAASRPAGRPGVGVAVAPCAAPGAAMPKSMSLYAAGEPRRALSSITLAGHMSRWTRPASCTATSAEATAMPTSTTSGTGRRPSARSRSASDSPPTYSMASPTMPRASSTGSA